MEASNQSSGATAGIMDKENLKSFYKKQLPGILKTVFLKPVNGTYDLFKQPGEGVYGNALLLMLSTMILYFLTPYILAGKYLREILSFGMLLKCGLVAGLFMLIISTLSFGIKSISGKPVFKQELLTGALCGIGLVLLLVVVLLVKMFGSSVNVYDMMNPAGIIRSIGFMMVFIVYIFLFMINIFQQSLRASGTQETISWYISPIAIMFAFYITGKLAAEFLMPSSPF
ncbi:hypothetical protein COR50_14945 [Chitinophaga caeni]|uniref:Yip1 domain-containing protein n=1 Tax=Chitinophaga caeni TaxID=2029983 RepID=A0A291QWU3_9BACT|nr:hypothetical protein [Chitinophaga caeni]ATL48352.1 hypothetical protein COR50_14945 [Chitinophaga caeni]